MKTRQACEENTAATRKEYKTLVTAVDELIGCFLSLNISAQQRSYVAQDKSVALRMFIVAQFTSGLEAVHSSLLGGQYPMAANGLKQQLELVAVFDKLAEQARYPNKINVPNTLPKFRDVWNRLNELAHPKNPEIVELLSRYNEADRTGPTIYPKFRTQSAKDLLSVFINIMLQMLNRKSTLFEETFNLKMNDFEKTAIKEAREVLHARDQIAG